MVSAASVLAPNRSDLWTADDFLDWIEPGIHADLIHGSVFMHSPVNFKHARLLNFLDPLLRLYVQEKRLGELHREVVAVRLSSRTVVLPDLAYFTKEQVSHFKDTYAPVAPTFVVEVISPGSIDNDTRDKFTIYEEYGVCEYWILDPENLQHRFFRRRGEFLKEFGSTGKVIRSESIPGFWVKRAWLDPGNLPLVKGSLEEIIG